MSGVTSHYQADYHRPRPVFVLLHIMPPRILIRSKYYNTVFVIFKYLIFDTLLLRKFINNSGCCIYVDARTLRISKIGLKKLLVFGNIELIIRIKIREMNQT
jgi:hypothetical protein